MESDPLRGRRFFLNFFPLSSLILGYISTDNTGRNEKLYIYFWYTNAQTTRRSHIYRAISAGIRTSSLRFPCACCGDCVIIARFSYYIHAVSVWLCPNPSQKAQQETGQKIARCPKLMKHMRCSLLPPTMPEKSRGKVLLVN